MHDEHITRNDVVETESQIPLSEPSPYMLGPVTSTQVGTDVVIPDTEDQEEYRRCYNDPEQQVIPAKKIRRVNCY